MSILRRFSRLVLSCATVSALSAPAVAQFDTASVSESNVFAETSLDTGLGPNFDFDGGLLSPAYPTVSRVHSSSQSGKLGSTTGEASQSADVTPTRLVGSGSVNTDTDGFGELGGEATASAVSSMFIRFTITQPHRWTFHYGSVTGTHAGGSVSLYPTGGKSPAVFFFDSIFMPFFDGETGEIPAGTYDFTAEVSAYTFSGDGFGGLFAGASVDFDFELQPLTPPACPGDADGNNSVNFADITSVLTNFGTDYSPGTGEGDADHNGPVNFADITSVLTNFGSACS